MPQVINLKNLPPDELSIYNKLYPCKVALLTLKKGQSFTLAELAEISDKVSSLAEQLAELRGVSDDEIGAIGSDHDAESHSVASSAGNSPRNALDALFDTTHQLVLELFAQADKVAPSMLPIYTQLIAIQNALEDMKVDACFTLEDIHVYQRRLREIELAHVRQGILFAKLNYGYRLANTLVVLIDTLEDQLLPIHEQFRAPGTDRALRGQQLVVAIMEHCYELITDLCNKKDKHRWEVRPQDLYPLVNGVFYPVPIPGVVQLSGALAGLQLSPPSSSEGMATSSGGGAGAGGGSATGSGATSAAASPALTAQPAKAPTTPPELVDPNTISHLPPSATANGTVHVPPAPGSAAASPAPASLHYLLHKCHCHITKLQATIEPVDPALMHIHHHLIAVRKCLVELRRLGGPFAPQELYPFQLKLKSFDDMRVDGKFVVEGEAGVPAGQGVLHSLLSECYDILNELKAEVEWD
ncbi:hypothetical protein BCR44DRAFT_1439015 [Catenaria anguillulae PL171]|uniref:Uncharacterized protein n=1 Tax=Catenaria anguillulae PL171 TaxID=765915 RepID=A0A1Y2HGD0_9FUNG|nr:hypothetical protein BCR44DRAFT_1439015 [Catenaria anguillulae PL171]